MRVSAIVPTLDEADRIGPLVRRLRELGVDEIIVADGGSGDATATLAVEAGAVVTRSKRGRAVQMNAGARCATGDVLWFVHADVQLPDGIVAEIRRAVEDPSVVGGAFHTRTVDERRSGRMPRWMRLADLRQAYTRTPYGDQAVFARATAFREVGRFDEGHALFEDFDLSRRLRRRGRLVILRPEILVSARRYYAHPLRSLVAMNLFPVAYRLGMPTRWLARLYGRGR